MRFSRICCRRTRSATTCNGSSEAAGRACAARLDRHAARLEGVADLRANVERFAAKLDGPARDARDVEQVFDEARHLRDLPVHRFEELLLALAHERLAAKHVQRRAQRRERVAQLVRERREEFVLAPVGVLDLLVEEAIVERARGAPGRLSASVRSALARRRAEGPGRA
jgi:hypothetical protein